ncbi:MAG: DUF1540 domain-containing protein [Oscillospiraceae bacterium]|nr:DUF1540 domain-containing protein [Oscillospiraceae bacterium]
MGTPNFVNQGVNCCVKDCSHYCDGDRCTLKTINVEAHASAANSTGSDCGSYECRQAT